MHAQSLQQGQRLTFSGQTRTLARPSAQTAHHKRCRAAASAAAPAIEDRWIAKNFVAFKDGDANPSLAPLHSQSWKALGSLRMPSTRTEEYRFTDISPLLKTAVQPARGPLPSPQSVSSLVFPEARGCSLVMVDGVLQPQLSDTSALPQGVYVGGLAGAPRGTAGLLGSLSGARGGGPFAVLNGAAARDVLCVCVPSGMALTQPIYVLHLASGSSSPEALAGSAPRLLLHAGPGSVVELVEEWVGAEGSSSGSSSGGSLVVAVAEVVVEQDAVVKHGYVERESPSSYHFRSTLVQQAQASSYSLTEARLGGSMTRHDLGITQVGPETSTSLKHFLLAGSAQLHDLHSKLELNHPEGRASQLHKCIASHSTARGVFDGNVKVNRLAQRTDAGQLSRNLLLVPRATVNVKPNLQIIADDVKCTHGCAVSDLSDEEVFYFRARGISSDLARQALVFSFGAEVVQQLGYKALTDRVQANVAGALSTADIFKGQQQ